MARRRKKTIKRLRVRNKVEARAAALPAARPCWVCAQPMTAGVLTTLLGVGSLEVHQRCYEAALRS
jgi:hypothetical protein